MHIPVKRATPGYFGNTSMMANHTENDSDPKHVGPFLRCLEKEDHTVLGGEM